MCPHFIFYKKKDCFGPKILGSFYLLLTEYMLNIYLMGVLTFYTQQMLSVLRCDFVAVLLLLQWTMADH